MGKEIRFGAAVIFARKIKVEKRLVKSTSAHRMQVAKAEQGYMIIEKEWKPV